MSDTHFQRMKDLPSTHLLGAGTAMCAGCGGLAAVTEVYDVLGENTVFVNAAGCMTVADDSFERRIETVGRNLPHQEVKVADLKTGAAIPVGEIGEPCFRGYHVMLGYYNDDDATRNTIDTAGWLHSGDLGAMDEDGYLRITGRLKEMIIRGGENIYPAEIEAYLFANPKISQAAVFGVSDERLGEDIAVWVQLHDGETMTEDELRDYCRTGLAHFKTPRHVRFVTSFPMTVTGKLQKFRMREMAEKDLSG